MVVESVGGAEVGEQLPSRDILQQHVEKTIIVMSPDPVSVCVEYICGWGRRSVYVRHLCRGQYISKIQGSVIKKALPALKKI